VGRDQLGIEGLDLGWVEALEGGGVEAVNRREILGDRGAGGTCVAMVDALGSWHLAVLACGSTVNSGLQVCLVGQDV
jgi:hypothetical protein